MKTKISIEWSIEDVLCRATDMEKKVSRKQASEILELLESEHDANIGINWDNIDYWTDYVLKGGVK